jgi:hypothetical protein
MVLCSFFFQFKSFSVKGSARRTADSPLMNFVPESDSETEDEAGGPSPERSIVEETQAYNTEPVSRKLLTFPTCQVRINPHPTGLQVYIQTSPKVKLQACYFDH